MRRPRDVDAELEALQRRARALKGRRTLQLGELVAATGADRLDPEVLAGALLAAARAPAAERERWRSAGAAVFQGAAGPDGAAPGDGARRTQGGGDDAAS